MASCRCREIQQCQDKLEQIRKMEVEIRAEEANIIHLKERMEQTNVTYPQVFESAGIGCLTETSIVGHEKKVRVFNSIRDNTNQRKGQIQAELGALQEEDKTFHEEERKRLEELAEQESN